jgi:hypothetical protein
LAEIAVVSRIVSENKDWMGERPKGATSFESSSATIIGTDLILQDAIPAIDLRLTMSVAVM